MSRLQTMRSLASAGNHVFNIPRQILADLSRRAYAQRRRRQLEQLDGSILSDIGLTRAKLTAMIASCGRLSRIITDCRAIAQQG